jgi:N-acetylmuramoyl-L-alanine amidase
MGAIRRIFLHCSDSPDDRDIGVKEIEQWHLERGFREIGYHHVVRRNGIIEVGRYENGDGVLIGAEIGAHAKGHNADSLGICWVGRDKMTPEQRTSLFKLLASLLKLHGLDVDDVYGHYEVDPKKTCPNVVMPVFRADLRAFLALAETA